MTGFGMVEYGLRGCCFTVHNALGPGLLEAVYHNALCVELGDRGFGVQREVPFRVFYKNERVGEYYADIVVNGSIIVEVKSARAFVPEMKAQIVNYMHLSGCRTGFLVNFGGERVEIMKFVLPP